MKLETIIFPRALSAQCEAALKNLITKILRSQGRRRQIDTKDIFYLGLIFLDQTLQKYREVRFPRETIQRYSSFLLLKIKLDVFL